MDKGKLANLLKETEKELFRANRQLGEIKQLSQGIGRIYRNLVAVEAAIESSPALGKHFEQLMKSKQVIGQMHSLNMQLNLLRESLVGIEESGERAIAFVEKYRKQRLYSFKDSKSAVRFQSQLMELLGLQSAMFTPRFIGTIDVAAVAQELRLRQVGKSLLVPAKDLQRLARYMLGKGIASNMLLTAGPVKVQWQDSRNIAVNSDLEKLKRMDRLCTALSGTCQEK